MFHAGTGLPGPLCNLRIGGLVLTGKAADLKSAGRKAMGVRIPRPPYDLGFRKSLSVLRKPLFLGYLYHFQHDGNFR